MSHRKRTRRPERSEREEPDETGEDRLYREARRRANARIGFYTHLIAYLAVFSLVLVTAGFRPAFVMGLAWGIGLAFHWFGALVAPQLRRRLVEQEVQRGVADGLHRERKSLGAEHARTLEQLSASIAHEIRNPITAAKSLVQQMGEDPASSANVDYAKVALDELDRVERSISHLLRYAREEEMDVRDVRLTDVIDSALETFRDRVAKLGVRVTRELDGEGALRADAEKLRRVMINLIGNALDALEQARTPDPELRILAGENLAGTRLWVRVRDNGPGIEPAALAGIFSPFATGKPNGTGLGLAISKKLVDAHGGSIEVHSQPGGGTEFVLTFPKPAAARA
jgi:signal transduction histidine kinase